MKKFACDACGEEIQDRLITSDDLVRLEVLIPHIAMVRIEVLKPNHLCFNCLRKLRIKEVLPLPPRSKLLRAHLAEK